MRPQRLLLAFGMFACAGTILGTTAAYGLYYRSEAYRQWVEGALVRFFGLPTDVAAIRPNTLESRLLRDIEMWLPGRRARIFHCPAAVWDASGRVDGGTALHLYEPSITVGSEEWESHDYMAVLKASLLHDFSDLDIREVHFNDGQLAWPRHDLQIMAEGVNGIVTFDEQGRGEAVLTSQSLNGTRVAEPIRIRALIDPANEDDFLPEVTLEVPPLPLATLGLDQVLQSRITRGSFAGRITLRQAEAADTVEISGRAEDVSLEEFTRRLEGGPLAGTVDLTIHRGMLLNRELCELRFDGELRDVVVDPLLQRFGLPAIGGKVNLRVDNGRLEGESVAALSLFGHWHHGSLAGLSQLLLGTPGVEGRLDVRINSLVVRDDEIASGNIDLLATPPADQPGTIDRDLLLGLLDKHLGLHLPAVVTRMLPESVEFVRGEAKLLIDGTRLQILTLPDPVGDGAILTIRIAGREMPLVRNIDHVFDLAPAIENARRRALEWKQNLRNRR